MLGFVSVVVVVDAIGCWIIFTFVLTIFGMEQYFTVVVVDGLEIGLARDGFISCDVGWGLAG